MNALQLLARGALCLALLTSASCDQNGNVDPEGTGAGSIEPGASDRTGSLGESSPMTTTNSGQSPADVNFGQEPTNDVGGTGTGQTPPSPDRADEVPRNQ